MKKAKGDFKDRYGDDAEAVMYATATKMAKKESKDQETDESGIMYRAGVKKYGKDGMKKIQSAAGKGASAEEIGKIKDKHNKKKKESFSSLEESVGKAITEEEFEKLAEKIFQECFRNKRIETMKIRLEKLDAIQGAASAGIEVERSRL